MYAIGRTGEFTLLALATAGFAAGYAAGAWEGAAPAAPSLGAFGTAALTASFAALLVVAGLGVLALSPRDDWNHGVVVGALYFRAAPLALLFAASAATFAALRALAVAGLVPTPPGGLGERHVAVTATACALFLTVLATLAAVAGRGRESANRARSTWQLRAAAVLALACAGLVRADAWLAALR